MYYNEKQRLIIIDSNIIGNSKISQIKESVYFFRKSQSALSFPLLVIISLFFSSYFYLYSHSIIDAICWVLNHNQILFISFNCISLDRPDILQDILIICTAVITIPVVTKNLTLLAQSLRSNLFVYFSDFSYINILKQIRTFFFETLNSILHLLKYLRRIVAYMDPIVSFQHASLCLQYILFH